MSLTTALLEHFCTTHVYFYLQKPETYCKYYFPWYTLICCEHYFVWLNILQNIENNSIKFPSMVI